MIGRAEFYLLYRALKLENIKKSCWLEPALRKHRVRSRVNSALIVAILFIWLSHSIRTGGVLEADRKAPKVVVLVF